jgi:hypothetical protein
MNQSEEGVAQFTLVPLVKRSIGGASLLLNTIEYNVAETP